MTHPAPDEYILIFMQMEAELGLGSGDMWDGDPPIILVPAPPTTSAGDTDAGGSIRGHWYFFAGASSFVIIASTVSLKYGIPVVGDIGLLVGVYLFAVVAFSF